MTRPPRTPPHSGHRKPAPRHGAHETEVAWICCDTVFEHTRAIIEHLRVSHGIDNFRGETTLNGVHLGDETIAVYECRLEAGVTVTKTVSTTAVTP